MQAFKAPGQQASKIVQAAQNFFEAKGTGYEDCVGVLGELDYAQVVEQAVSGFQRRQARRALRNALSRLTQAPAKATYQQEFAVGTPPEAGYNILYRNEQTGQWDILVPSPVPTGPQAEAPWTLAWVYKDTLLLLAFIKGRPVLFRAADFHRSALISANQAIEMGLPPGQQFIRVEHAPRFTILDSTSLVSADAQCMRNAVFKPLGGYMRTHPRDYPQELDDLVPANYVQEAQIQVPGPRVQAAEQVPLPASGEEVGLQSSQRDRKGKKRAIDSALEVHAEQQRLFEGLKSLDFANLKAVTRDATLLALINRLEQADQILDMVGLQEVRLTRVELAKRLSTVFFNNKDTWMPCLGNDEQQRAERAQWLLKVIKLMNEQVGAGADE